MAGKVLLHEGDENSPVKLSQSTRSLLHEIAKVSERNSLFSISFWNYSILLQQAKSFCWYETCNSGTVFQEQ